MQFCVHNQKGIIKLLKNNGLMGTVCFFSSVGDNKAIS